MTLANKDKISKAKAKLVMMQPFFASLICNMPMYEDATINPPTMCTNGKYIKWHPEFVEKCTLDETMFVLCHEVGHPMLMHMLRRGERHPVLWNIAGDYIINDMLIKENIGSMPEGGLHDPAKVKAGGGTTEGVYELLREEYEKQGGLPDISDQFDNCEDAGGSEADQTLTESEWKIAVQQAANAAKMCGRLGSSLERFVSEVLKPKVDWRAALRRFVNKQAKIDRSYARPKRRFLAENLYLPGLSGERLGEIVVAVDCSGSIASKEIDEFAAELRAIKEDMLPDMLHVVYFHSEVCKHDRFPADEELVIAPNGTGGTAFSPIFLHLAQEGIEPECAVVLTDLCCNDFGDDPGYPVLWVSTMKGRAPWGDVILMQN
jgi:predicted metal-dependent peptidase